MDGGAPWRAVDGDPASVNSGEPRGIGERERGGGAREENGGVGLGFAAPRGSCSAREQVERGPAAVVVRRACRCLSAGSTVTRTKVGATCQREKERGERGWAVRCAVVGDWAGPLAGLVASRAGFLFFFENLFIFLFWFLKN